MLLIPEWGHKPRMWTQNPYGGHKTHMVDITPIWWTQTHMVDTNPYGGHNTHMVDTNPYDGHNTHMVDTNPYGGHKPIWWTQNPYGGHITHMVDTKPIWWTQTHMVDMKPIWWTQTHMVDMKPIWWTQNPYGGHEIHMVDTNPYGGHIFTKNVNDLVEVYGREEDRCLCFYATTIVSLFETDVEVRFADLKTEDNKPIIEKVGLQYLCPRPVNFSLDFKSGDAINVWIKDRWWLGKFVAKVRCSQAVCLIFKAGREETAPQFQKQIYYENE
ncbi:hypothetical protein LXL04_020475 [Taraxacum kok-saghyz]